MKKRHKVLATLLVRDEADIVQECIDHHVKNGVTGFLITDNRSTDNTDEICRKHPACLYFRRERSKIFDQGRWVTRMARKAAKMGATWVINLDADEFYYGLEVLRYMPKSINRIHIRKRCDHILTEEIPYGPFKRGMTPFYTLPSPRLKKGKTVHRASPLVEVGHGNHFVTAPWTKGLITDAHLPDMCYHHYWHRSRRRFEIKCRNTDSFMNRLGHHRTDTHFGKLHALHQKGRVNAAYQNLIHDPVEVALAYRQGKLGYYVPAGEESYVPEKLRTMARGHETGGFIAGSTASRPPKAGRESPPR